MQSSKTLFMSYPEQSTKSTKNKSIKYFIVNKRRLLRNKVIILLEKINYDLWKNKLKNQVIDILFNSMIIALVIILFKTRNAFLVGISITLFFILLKSYVEEFLKTFKR